METVYTRSNKVNLISDEIKHVLHKHLDSVLSQQSNFENMIKNIPFVKDIINENNLLKDKCNDLQVKLLEAKVVNNVDNSKNVDLKIIDINDKINSNTYNLPSIDKKNTKIDKTTYPNITLFDLNSDSESSDSDNQTFSELVNNLKRKSPDEEVKNVLIDLNVNKEEDDEEEDDPQIVQFKKLNEKNELKNLNRVNEEVKRLKEEAKKKKN